MSYTAKDLTNSGGTALVRGTGLGTGAANTASLNFSTPTFPTGGSGNTISVIPGIVADITDTATGHTATLATLPLRSPFTCTSSLVLRPPVCGNVTCQRRTFRASENCLSQVTPHSVMPSATSTVMPTWISLVRLKLSPSS